MVEALTTDKKVILTLGVLFGVLSLSLIWIKLRLGSIKRSLKKRDAAKMASSLLRRHCDEPVVAQTLNGEIETFDEWIQEARKVFPKLHLQGRRKGVYEGCFRLLTEYAQLRNDVDALVRSTDFVALTEELQPMALKGKTNDWTYIGYQRSDSPETDYRAAGALAPVMLGMTCQQWPEKIDEVLDKEGSYPYFFAIANLAFAFHCSCLLHSCDKLLVKRLLSETNLAAETEDIGWPFKSIPAPGSNNRLWHEFCRYHLSLCSAFDTHFISHKYGLMDCQAQLSRFINAL